MTPAQIPWKHRAKQWFVLIGIPIILLLLGLWQQGRARVDGDVSARIAAYQEALGQLDAIQARNPNALVTVDDKGHRIAASLLRSRISNTLADLESGGLQRTTRGLEPVLSMITVACSALALLCAGVGLLYQRRMARQAMRSREQLLQAFLRGKRLLPVYMMAMVLLLFAAAVAAMVFEIMPVLRQGHQSRGDIKMMFALALFAGMLLLYGVMALIDVIRAVRRPLEVEPIEVMGRMVTREQVPALWTFVSRVAERIGTDMPDAIVIGLNEGFFVTEHPVRLASGTDVPKGRVLYLPLPYMAFLDAAEVSAVVGHELGHFIGEDTIYSQRFSPIYTASIRQIVAVGGNSGTNDELRAALTRPATLFGEMFLGSFHNAVRFWSRKRELAADAVGARAASAQAVASSLLRIAALEPHVDEALASHWDQGGTVQGGVLAHVRKLVAERGMTDPSQHLQNRQAHPTDTHPELAERLDALGMSVNPTLLERAMAPAASPLLAELGLEQAGSETGQEADINATLQQELSSAATAHRRQKIEALTAIAQRVGAPVPVSERPLGTALVFALVAVGLGAGGISLVHKENPGTQMLGIVLLALTLAGLWLSFAWWRRGRKPALVVHQHGLQLFDTPAMLSWDAVDDFNFSAINGVFVVHLTLAPQTAPPALSVSRSRAQYIKKKGMLTIKLSGLGGKPGRKVAEVLLDYWRAHYAKKELQRMGEAEPPIESNDPLPGSQR